MIDLVWNFPMFAEQAAEWQRYLRRAVDDLHLDNPHEMQPSYRSAIAPLRTRAANWLGTEPERTFIVCSGHHGTLVALLAAGLAGKTIAVENITYTAILEQAKFLGATPVGCEYDREGMIPEALRAACQREPIAAVFLMPTVHNPLGLVAGLARRQAIVEVAREFNLILIEDDAYGFLEPDAPPTYAILAPERTFYIRGLSKPYAPATRTAFLITPASHVDKIDNVIANTSTGSSLVHNLAGLALIEDGTLNRVIAAKRAEGAVRNALGRQILSDAAAPGARNAWHLWVSLPESLTSADAQRICLDRGVMVSAATGYTPPGTEVPRAIRIALGAELHRNRVDAGLKIVADVISFARGSQVAEPALKR